MAPHPGHVRIVAHRGSGHAFTDPTGPPENTLTAVEHGFAHGADAVEVDVWRTRDGVVVLHHDRTTDRTTDHPGLTVPDATYAQLLAASAGAWKSPQWQHERVPTLTLAAALVPPDRALVVEVVEGPQVTPDVITALASSGLQPEQVVYISKNLDTAAELKGQAPGHRVLWVVDTIPRWQIGGWAQGHRRGAASERAGFDDPADVEWLTEQALRHNLDGLDTLFSYPPDLPAACVQAGLLWMVWSVNDPRAIAQCLDDGVWAVTTDNPAEVRAWLQ